MQGPNAVLNTMTLPPGATQTQQRIVIDGIRGAMFLYQNGGQLVGSIARIIESVRACGIGLAKRYGHNRSKGATVP